jgi:hypothetical protein
MVVIPMYDWNKLMLLRVSTKRQNNCDVKLATHEGPTNNYMSNFSSHLEESLERNVTGQLEKP